MWNSKEHRYIEEPSRMYKFTIVHHLVGRQKFEPHKSIQRTRVKHTGSGRGGTALMGVMLGTESVSSLAGAGTNIASTVLDSQAAQVEEGEDESDKDKRRNQSNNRRPATQVHRG
ncbi:hypothetical protein MTO96_050850 [Rhipicephalus appendiculatus]